MARRKAATRSRGRAGTPAWMWLATGILIGLGLAWYLFAKGMIPQPEPPEPQAAETAQESASSEEIAPAEQEQKTSRYDFFTVLPEMDPSRPAQVDPRNIVEAIHDLVDDPRPLGAKLLKGVEAWSLRVGPYRVIYEIEDDLLIITVIKIGHRRDIYRQLR